MAELLSVEPQQVGAQLAQMLPPGRAWPREASTLRGTLDGAGHGLAAAQNRLLDLLEEADPRTTFDLLTDWERVAGLPDQCAGVPETLELRRQLLAQKLTGTGGQSRSYFTELARTLGFDIVIEEFRPFRFGDRFGGRLNGQGLVHAWRVMAPSVTVRPFRFRQGRFGERFRSWGNTLLECVLRDLKPAHTEILFAYVEPATAFATPLLWIDTGQSAITQSAGLVTRVAGAFATARALVPMPQAEPTVITAPPGLPALRFNGDPADLVYAVDPALPNLETFRLFLVAKGGATDPATGLGSAWPNAELVLGPTIAVVGTGANRRTIAHAAGVEPAWRVISLTVDQRLGERRIEARWNLTLAGSATAPAAPLTGPAVLLAEELAVVGILPSVLRAEHRDWIERSLMRRWAVAV